MHVELSPSHTPHSSKVEVPFGTPAQSAHDVLSPSHTPHSSAKLPSQSQAPPTYPVPTLSIENSTSGCPPSILFHCPATPPLGPQSLGNATPPSS